MAKKEVKTDKWVEKLLEEAGITADYQGSDNIEINEALKTASKSGKNTPGYPEFVAVVNEYVIVIEDKADLKNHVSLKDGVISTLINDVENYAINGAYHYAKHIARKTSFKQVFAIGISGNEKHHRISPLFVDDRESYVPLSDVETLLYFNSNNIQEYYTKEVLNEKTDKDKELRDILNEAKELHEHLRNYGGSIRDVDKPILVSGILLSLRERDNKGFDISHLIGDKVETDGMKIWKAIETNLQRSNVQPDKKKNIVLSNFTIIRDNYHLNEIHPKLNKTPLRFFTEFIDNKIYKAIKYNKSSEDYIGRFYGEFMSYSGGDGQSLGIILTPKHITELFVDLVDLKENDIVFDPCCGSGGFLIASLYKMLQLTDDERKRYEIKREQLHGIEVREDMFTLATTNMIIRGDGKSNIERDDFLKKNSNMLQLKQATVGMMNPPYSQGSKEDTSQYEIHFVEHLLDSLTEGARCVVIVPQSTVTGKTSYEQETKDNILKHHTLEGVITLNKNTFYGVGTNPCIAIFTARIPHSKNHVCKFINFEDDGYEVFQHIGLLETESAKDKKQHLLDVWFDRCDTNTKFCVKTTVESSDEWLHSFYYFNDEIPTDGDFEKVVEEYLTFEYSMVIQDKEYLFQDGDFK